MSREKKEISSLWTKTQADALNAPLPTGQTLRIKFLREDLK